MRGSPHGISGRDLPAVGNPDGTTTTPPLWSHHVRSVSNRATYRAPPRWRLGSFHVNLCLLILLIMSIGGTLVTATGVESRTILLQSTFERLARRGEILMDHRPPPPVRELQRRQLLSTIVQSTRSASQDSPTAQTSMATPTSSESTTSSLEPSTTSTTTTDPDAESPSPPPRPFDTSLGANFTASCPNFFQQFLGSSEFLACLPFSLLLQVSRAMTLQRPGRKQTKVNVTTIRTPIHFSKPRKAVSVSPKLSMPRAMSTSILARVSCHD